MSKVKPQNESPPRTVAQMINVSLRSTQQVVANYNVAVQSKGKDASVSKQSASASPSAGKSR